MTSLTRSFFFILLFCTGQSLHATNIDSLRKELGIQTDTLKVKVLNELCFAVVYNDVQLSKAYGFEALRLARGLDHPRGMAVAYTRIGIAYDVASDFDSAIWCYNQALIYFALCNNAHGKASALNNKAMVYSNRGLYKEALTMYMGALKVFEALGEQTHIANALNNIAVLYLDLYLPRLSLAYSRRALELYRQQGNASRIAAVYTNMGLAYNGINSDSSLFYIRKAVQIKESLNERFGLSISYTDMGIVYVDKNKPDSAIYYFEKSLALRKVLNDQFGEASVLINLANAYNHKHDARARFIHLEKALKLAEKLQSYRLLYKISFALSDYYGKAGRYKEALAYHKLFAEYKDSTLNENTSKQIRELEAKYQTEKKELQLRNTSLALQASEAGLRQKRTQVALLLALFGTVAILALFIYFYYTNQQKRKLALEKIAEEQARNRAVIKAENEERKRIAKDLHDGVGQQLSAVKMNLSAWASGKGTDELDTVMGMLDDAVKEVRSVSHSMIPNALLNTGLASAVRDFMNKIALSGKIQVELQVVGITQRLDEQTETTLYRVIQECVNNVIKHAGAHHLSLQLISHPQHILLMIEDDGRGFDTQHQAGGIGIKNIESRVAFLNGQMHIDSSPGNGTTITIEIPHNQ